MKINTRYFKIEIDFWLITYLAISIFSIKVRNFLSSYYTCYLFIIFHELSHILIASIFGYKVEVFNFTISGVNITLNKDVINDDIAFIKKIMIYFTGPLSNFIFAFLFRDIKMVFEINIFLGMLNFLPIFPLDGYNLAYLIFRKISTNKINNIDFLQNIFIVLFVILGLIQIVFYKNISLLIFAIYIFMLRTISGKNCRKKY